MQSNVDKTISDRREQGKKAFTTRNERRNRYTPATREQWAEVLATADRYY